MYSLSVCIPVKNSAWCLPLCLRSLEIQTVQPLEYLFCVSESTDNSLELITKFCEKMDQNGVHVEILLDTEDRGTGYARDLLLKTAKGTEISWVDADFVFPKNFFESVMYLKTKYEFDGLEAETVERTIPELNVFESNGELYENFIADVKDSKLYPATPIGRYGFGRNLLNRKKSLAVGSFDSFFRRGQDVDHAYRLNHHGVVRKKCSDLKYYHIGLLNVESYKGFWKNTIGRCTYLKFLYKYGVSFVRLDYIHTFMFLYRMFMLLMFFLLGWNLMFVGSNVVSCIKIIFVSFFVLFASTYGYYRNHGFRPRLFMIQFMKIFGELLVILQIINTVDRKPFGYGIKNLKTVMELD